MYVGLQPAISCNEVWVVSGMYMSSTRNALASERTNRELFFYLISTFRNFGHTTATCFLGSLDPMKFIFVGNPILNRTKKEVLANDFNLATNSHLELLVNSC